MLIDSGFGDNGPPTGNNLLSNMSAAGIDPKNIDTILVSHFHGDHISGIRAKGGCCELSQRRDHGAVGRRPGQ